MLTKWFYPVALGRKFERRNRSQVETVLFVVAVVAIAIITTGTYLIAGIGNQETRQSERVPGMFLDLPATFTWFQTETHSGSNVINTTLISINPDQNSRNIALPPGLSELPKLGTTLVSPKLAELIASHPKIAQRIQGKIVGTLPQDLLYSPTSLQALSHVTAENTVYEANTWGRAEFETSDTVPAKQTQQTAFLLLMLPGGIALGIIFSTKTRQLENHVARLARMGFGSKQINRFAAGQVLPYALSTTIIGIITGITLAQIISSWQIIGTTFFMPQLTTILKVAGLLTFAILLTARTVTRIKIRNTIKSFLTPTSQPVVAGAFHKIFYLAAALLLLTATVLLWRSITHDATEANNTFFLLFTLTALPLIGLSFVFSTTTVDLCWHKTRTKDPLETSFALSQLRHNRSIMVIQTLTLISLGAVYTVNLVVQTQIQTQSQNPADSSQWVATMPASAENKLERLLLASGLNVDEQNEVVSRNIEGEYGEISFSFSTDSATGVDEIEARLLEIVPSLDFYNGSAYKTATYALPKVTRITTIFLGLGFLIAAMMFFITSQGNSTISKSHERLIRLGASRRTNQRFSATRNILGSTISGVVALILCAILGQGYLSLIGEYTVSAATLLTYVALTLGGAAVSGGLAQLAGTRKATR